MCEQASNNVCECVVCKLGARIDEVVASRDVDKLIELVHYLSNQLVETGFELEQKQSVLRGDWPSSIQILNRSLARAIAFQAEEDSHVFDATI